MGRVVAGPDRVEVVALHQQHVGQHDVLVDGPTQVGMELVAVDPPEQDPAAVDGQQAVPDGDGPEADAQRHPLAGRGELAVVQPGRLGRPRLDGLQPHRVPGGHVHPQLGHLQLGHLQAGGDVGVDPQGAGAGR